MREVETIEAMVQRPYTRILVPSEDGGFVGEVLEFPGCFGQGETADEAMADLEGAMRDWVEEAQSAGQQIPEPLGAREFSGRLVLRMPESLHRAAALRATHEHVSLNHLLLTAIATYLGQEDGADRLAEALARRLQLTVGVGAIANIGFRSLTSGAVTETSENYLGPWGEFAAAANVGRSTVGRIGEGNQR